MHLWRVVLCDFAQDMIRGINGGGEQWGLTSAAIVLRCNELACYQDPCGGLGSDSSVTLRSPANCRSAVHSAPAPALSASRVGILLANLHDADAGLSLEMSLFV